MMMRSIETSAGGYDDGGYAADLKLLQDTKILIKQGDSAVMFSRENWCQVRDAIDKMYDAMDGLAI